MTKQKPPKFRTKEQLQFWMYSVGRKNIDPAALKKERKRIKRIKKIGY